MGFNVKVKTIKLLGYRRLFFMASRTKDFSNKTQNALTLQEKIVSLPQAEGLVFTESHHRERRIQFRVMDKNYDS